MTKLRNGLIYSHEPNNKGPSETDVHVFEVVVNIAKWKEASSHLIGDEPVQLLVLQTPYKSQDSS